MRDRERGVEGARDREREEGKRKARGGRRCGDERRKSG